MTSMHSSRTVICGGGGVWPGGCLTWGGVSDLGVVSDLGGVWPGGVWPGGVWPGGVSDCGVVSDRSCVRPGGCLTWGVSDWECLTWGVSDWGCLSGVSWPGGVWTEGVSDLRGVWPGECLTWGVSDLGVVSDLGGGVWPGGCTMWPIPSCIWCYLYAASSPTETHQQCSCLYSAGWSCDLQGILGYTPREENHTQL